MSKKKTSKKSKEPVETQAMTRNRYGWCEEEILTEIIEPKIAYILSNCGPVESKAHLLALMQDAHSTSITASSLSYWCEKLGYTFRKVIVVERQGAPTGYVQATQQSEGLGESFDNERRGEVNPQYMPQVGGITP